MSVHWHRICFDPRSNREQFSNSEAFARWLGMHFSQFDYQSAGYIILPWNETVNTMGVPLWNILIPGKSSYRNDETDILRYLSEKHWVVDNYDTIVYLKYTDGGNELLFPIREKSNA